MKTAILTGNATFITLQKIFQPMTTGIGITGIDHPAIAVRDVDKMADWYCDLLGYKKYYRHEKPVWMLLAPDNTLLEIMPIDDTPRPARTIRCPKFVTSDDYARSL